MWLYLSWQASSLRRYLWEQALLAAFGWIPTVLGIVPELETS